jgi:cytochrome b561
MSAGTYDPRARTLHWISLVLLMVILLAIWWPEEEGSETAYAWRLLVHRSAGLLLFALTLLRLGVRLLLRTPPLPAGLPQLQRFAACANIAAIYTVLFAQPILGLVHSQAGGDRVSFLGLFDVPALAGRNRALARLAIEWHEGLAILLLVLIGLHIAAALYHHHIRRDGVLASMWPGLRRDPPRG